MTDTWDFKGWVIKYNDTIKSNYFKCQDSIKIPLLVDGGSYTNPDNVIGYAILEAREEGIYCYGYFNNNDIPQTQNTKEALQEGILTRLDIHGNKIKEKYFKIIAISLCSQRYATNPEARIEVIQV